jgi:hypothetical protein
MRKNIPAHVELKCDRCKTVTQEGELSPGAYCVSDFQTISTSLGAGHDQTVDLCKPCFTALQRWLKGEA